jgi:hypothetical protein
MPLNSPGHVLQGPQVSLTGHPSVTSPVVGAGRTVEMLRARKALVPMRLSGLLSRRAMALGPRRGAIFSLANVGAGSNVRLCVQPNRSAAQIVDAMDAHAVEVLAVNGPRPKLLDPSSRLDRELRELLLQHMRFCFDYIGAAARVA